MLEPAPCLVPTKEDEGGNKEADSGPHSLLVPTEGMSASVREDNQGEESDILSPQGRKRTTSEDPETTVIEGDNAVFACGRQHLLTLFVEYALDVRILAAFSASRMNSVHSKIRLH